ncbi:MAG: VanW family protein, partial [Firmicutes bacterium]|nr:VanW family protein [Bacillota bacterium]
DEFSFNRIVGPRSSDAGYKSADVIINNEFVEGLGGGVCQVSSTLYNAVLLANLRITERNNHSLPVGYVPIGRDATVVYEAVDFRFANNTDFYVYIKTCVTGNDLTVKLYGNKDKTPRVEVSSWVTETIQPHVVYEKDPNLAAGEKVVKQEGNDGFKAAAVRNIWQNGRKVTETLPASHYHPVRRIVAIGTGASKPAVVFPQDQDLTPSVDLPGTTFVDQPVAPDTGPQDETETGGDTAKNDIDNGAAIGTESDPGVAAGDGYFENTAETGEQNGNDAPPPGDAGAQAQPE